MDNEMSKRNWSDFLQAQRDSGRSIEAFCRVGVRTGGLPIVIATPDEIAITVQFEARSLRLRGSATELAQLLRCV